MLHVNLGWAVVDVRTKMLNMLNIWLIIYRGKDSFRFFRCKLKLYLIPKIFPYD